MEVLEAFPTDVYMLPENVLITPLLDHYLADPHEHKEDPPGFTDFLKDERQSNNSTLKL